MRIVIVGSNGQLGTDLCQVLDAAGHDLIRLAHGDIDIRDQSSVDSVLGGVSHDLVVNTAAFHKVELCEQDAMSSFAVNAVGPRNLALACRKVDSVLVHFSTDYVFGGERDSPYKEDDLPGPLNVYGASKLAGEMMLSLTWPKHFIVRTSGLYGIAGSSGKGGNFVETMLRRASDGQAIKVVDDQVLTPTPTKDLALAMSKLILTKAYGLYHASAEGECSWYDFARQIFNISRLEVDLARASSREIASAVKRPSYSVLSKSRLRALGITMPDWNKGLAGYLQSRKRS